jgi:hypothetical protein
MPTRNVVLTERQEALIDTLVRTGRGASRTQRRPERSRKSGARRDAPTIGRFTYRPADGAAGTLFFIANTAKSKSRLSEFCTTTWT